ncbi:MAG: rhodanese-like domain-containing protein [Ilumatobacteraceae bacterium]
MSGAAIDRSAANSDTVAPAPLSLLYIGSRQSLPAFPEGTSVTVTDVAAATSAQLPSRFECVTLGARSLPTEPGGRRAVLHSAVQHLERGGCLIALHAHDQAPPHDEFVALGLTPAGHVRLGELIGSLFRRGERTSVHDLLFDARSTLRRIPPTELHSRLAAASPPLIIDTRTPSDRDRFGTIAGSVHLPRTVVEWRLDPAGGYLHPAVTGFDDALVVVCNHGYSSSLVAANLQRLGYGDVTDLIGGVQAWRAAGLPVVPPDHTFLEL